ncbi:MAG: hypothetical protein LBD33_03310 [Puniceicoccales bacterium]|nr:hypothetical protein [Puniceicoccales bacterium]
MEISSVVPAGSVFSQDSLPQAASISAPTSSSAAQSKACVDGDLEGLEGGEFGVFGEWYLAGDSNPEPID